MSGVGVAGAQAGSYVGGDQRLNFIISAVNMATPGIAAVQAGFANLTAVGMRTSDHLNQAMTAAESAALAVGAASALIAGYATYAAASFEKEMKVVEAVSGSTQENMAALSNGAKQMAMDYGLSSSEVARSMQELGRAGLSSATTQMETFRAAMGMAKIEGMDLNVAVDQLIKTVGLFGTSINDPNFGKAAEEMAADLTHASQISPTTVEDLMMGLKYFGGAAKEAGMGQKDTLAALSYMATVGVPGETAGTALRGFITKPTLQQPEVLEAFAQIGLSPESLWQADGSAAKPIFEQVKIIRDAMEANNLSTYEQMGLWAKISMQKTSQQMLKIDPAAMEDYYAKMQKDFDMQEKVRISMDSVWEQINRLKSGFEVAAINIGEKFLPILRTLVDLFNAATGAIANNQTVATGVALALGGGVLVGVASLAKWAWQIVVFLREANGLSGILAGLNASSTAATVTATRNTAALQGASILPATTKGAKASAQTDVAIATALSSAFGFSPGSQKLTRTKTETDSIKNLKNLMSGTGAGVGKTAEEATVKNKGMWASIGAAASGALTSIKSGLTSVYAALVGIGPVGWAAILLITGASLIALALWKEYEDRLKKVTKEYENSKKASSSMLQGVYKEIENLKDISPVDIRLQLNDKEFNAKVEEVSKNFDNKIKVKTENPLEFGVLGSSNRGGEKASTGPKHMGILGTDYTTGVTDTEAQFEVAKMKEMWPDLQKFESMKQAARPDDRKSQEAVAKGEATLAAKYGLHKEQIDSYTRALKLNWQAQHATTVQTQMFWYMLGQIGRLFGTILGIFGKSSGDAKEGSDGLKKSADHSVSAVDRMNQSLENSLEGMYGFAYELFKVGETLKKVSDVIAATMDMMKDPFNISGEKQQAVNDAYNALWAPIQGREGWIAEQKAWNPSFDLDASLIENGEELGSGSESGSGSGTGTGKEGGKGKVRGPGYSVDFIICSQKQLPPLDPNLFKRRPIIDLTQKTFSVDNIHINTRDKPEVIEATMKRAIVDISTSNRVNISTKDSKTNATQV